MRWYVASWCSVLSVLVACNGDAGTPDAAEVLVRVAITGNGKGTVTSVPGGIDCGLRCTALYAVGSEVELAAVAHPGSSFFGWTGAGCAGTGACTIAVADAVTVEPMFAAHNTFTVAVAGTG